MRLHHFLYRDPLTSAATAASSPMASEMREGRGVPPSPGTDSSKSTGRARPFRIMSQAAFVVVMKSIIAGLSFPGKPKNGKAPKDRRRGKRAGERTCYNRDAVLAFAGTQKRRHRMMEGTEGRGKHDHRRQGVENGAGRLG